MSIPVQYCQGRTRDSAFLTVVREPGGCMLQQGSGSEAFQFQQEPIMKSEHSDPFKSNV